MLTLVLLKGYGLIQLLIHFGLGLIDCGVLIFARPFRRGQDLAFNVVNSLVLLGLYSLLIASHFRGHHSGEIYEWVLVGVVVAFNCISMLAILITKSCEIKKRCRDKRKDQALQREARYKLRQRGWLPE